MDLISKKELLQEKGISYGQLYRWKRAGLIPEDWFIKQAAPTGQETFFQREKISKRVEDILAFKDQYSLEEMVEIIQNIKIMSIREEDLVKISELNKEILSWLAMNQKKDSYSVVEVAFLTAISKIAQEEQMVGKEVFSLVSRSFEELGEGNKNQKAFTVFLIGNQYYLVFHELVDDLSFDQGVLVKSRVSIKEMVEMLKIKYKELLKIKEEI